MSKPNNDVQINNEADAAKKALKNDLKPVSAGNKHKATKSKSVNLSNKAELPSNIFTKFGFTSSHLKYGLVLVAILTIGICGGYVVNSSQAEKNKSQPVVDSSSASIYLTPANQNISNNQSFSVAVKANSGATNVNAVQATISYPSNIVEVVSISTENSAYKLDVISSNSNGKITIARGQIGGITGDNIVANITFKSKSTGKATLKFINETALVDSKTNKNIISLPANAKNANLDIQ